MTIYIFKSFFNYKPYCLQVKFIELAGISLLIFGKENSF